MLQEVIAIAKYKARIAIIALYKKPASVDLFKVMALGKGIVEPLIGFSRGDRSATL